MVDLDDTLFVDRTNKHKTVQLAPEQIRQIRENPKNLTKEGAEFYLKNWRDNSRNHVMAVFYDTMLNGRKADVGDGRFELVKCANFTKSGLIKTETSASDGRRIYSRDNEGKPAMVESIERFKERARFQEAKDLMKKEIVE